MPDAPVLTAWELIEDGNTYEYVCIEPESFSAAEKRQACLSIEAHWLQGSTHWKSQTERVLYDDDRTTALQEYDVILTNKKQKQLVLGEHKHFFTSVSLSSPSLSVPPYVRVVLW